MSFNDERRRKRERGEKIRERNKSRHFEEDGGTADKDVSRGNDPCAEVLKRTEERAPRLA